MPQSDLFNQPPSDYEPKPLPIVGGELRGFHTGSWATGELEIEREDGARFTIHCEVLVREVYRNGDE